MATGGEEAQRGDDGADRMSAGWTARLRVPRTGYTFVTDPHETRESLDGMIRLLWNCYDPELEILEILPPDPAAPPEPSDPPTSQDA